MKLPSSINFEVSQDDNLFKSDIFCIEFVSRNNDIFTLEIFNIEHPSWRLRGDWQNGCCIEGVQEYMQVNDILTAAEHILFRAAKDNYFA